MKFRRIYAVFKARNLEYFRDRAAFAWNFIFPIIIIIGFALSFDNNQKYKFKIAVVGHEEKEQPQNLEFFTTDYIQFIHTIPLADAKVKVQDHRLDMLLDLQNLSYYVNDQSANGYVLEKILLGSDGSDKLGKIQLDGDSLRYVDWVVPGVLAMNIMFSALWGIGFVLVRYRKNGVLKRLKATPVSSVEFLIAQLGSRIWVIMATNLIVYFILDFFLNFTMLGSLLLLFFVILLGGICLISIGLVIASRVKSEEIASGLLNFISWPMMLLSEVWFSLEGANVYVQKLAQIFPLTHMTQAARLIMLDGAGLLDILPQILALILSSGLFLFVGSRLFRWE